MSSTPRFVKRTLLLLQGVGVGCALLVCAGVLPARAQESSGTVPALRFYPYEGELVLNEPVELEVRIFTAGEAVDSADVRFGFTPAMITVADGESGVAGVNLKVGTAFSAAVGNAVSTETNTATITTYSSSAPLNTGVGYSVIGTLQFTPAALGELEFTFAHTPADTTDSNIVQSVSSEDVLAQVRNARFSVVETLSQVPTPTPQAGGGDSGNLDDQTDSADDSSEQAASPTPQATAAIQQNTTTGGGGATIPTTHSDLPVQEQVEYQAPVFYDDPAVVQEESEGGLQRMLHPAVDALQSVAQATAPLLSARVTEVFAGAVLPIALLGGVAATPLLGLASILSNFSGTIRPQHLPQLVEALGFLPGKKPSGLVFDARTHKPVPFAVLTIQRARSSDQGEHLLETVISDAYGIIREVQLPVGEYALTAQHADHQFPTTLKRPAWLSVLEFYRGEIFAVPIAQQRRALFVPMDAIGAGGPWQLTFDYALQMSHQLLGKLFVPSAVLAVGAFALFPSVFNAAAVVFYAAVAFQRAEKLRHPRLLVQVADQRQAPVSGALVRVVEESGASLAAVGVSDDRGIAAFSVQAGRYQVLVQRSGYVQPPFLTTAEVRHRRTTVQAVLQKS